MSYKKSLLHLELFEHWKYYKLYICSLLYVYMLFNLQSLSVAYKMLCWVKKIDKKKNISITTWC